MGTRSTGRRPHGGRCLGAVLGAVVGAALYLLVPPVLEDADGWVRELQGTVLEPRAATRARGAAVGARWGGGPTA